VTAEALWIRALLGPWAGRESLGDKKPSLRRTDGGIAELVLGWAKVGWMACRKMAGREMGLTRRREGLAFGMFVKRELIDGSHAKA